ncbi:hypothetical protein J5N97_029523 [Dioscorea zingiberensis]|uniref:Uncharacterized protein n=1 Tax=Dioscorea zingiberensis TaxID=325984 RepID=A0A9D5C0F4_9LILI|nr:hypothetical protein J5N97_029523 [Dioscorea zingiberensis]
MGGGVGRVAKGATVKAAGGVAMILANVEEMGWSTLAEAHVLPASHVSYEAAEKIKTYIKSTAKPVATITPIGTLYGVPPPAPMVAYFSSRGPSEASPNILKPDIIGPGVNVLAAWPFQVGPVKASDTFNVISGTSMSTPHLSGIAALLKAAHPDWSPAAIKSAIMTSADIITRDGEPIPDQLMQPYNVFATGAGHVNPLEASNPGLVFDIGPEDYIGYLCGLGYNNKQVSAVTRRTVDCSSYPVGAADLNYPSITVSLDANGEASATRFVTNVGPESSEYKVFVQEPPGVRVFVEPDILRFTPQIKIGKISIKIQRVEGDSSYAVGSLAWASIDKVVRSPLLVVASSSMSGSLRMASKELHLHMEIPSNPPSHPSLMHAPAANHIEQAALQLVASLSCGLVMPQAFSKTESPQGQIPGAPLTDGLL